jgi:hypothetical protein
MQNLRNVDQAMRMIEAKETPAGNDVAQYLSSDDFIAAAELADAADVGELGALRMGGSQISLRTA